jgi:hypothetical protein
MCVVNKSTRIDTLLANISFSLSSDDNRNFRFVWKVPRVDQVEGKAICHSKTTRVNFPVKTGLTAGFRVVRSVISRRLSARGLEHDTAL